jgi:isoleucyl-tRNA synthetase
LLKESLARWGIDDYQVIAYGRALIWKAWRCAIRSTTAKCRSSSAITSPPKPAPALVHTAPAHGQEDYVVGSRYGLPVDNPVGPDGKFLPDTPLFAGLHVFAANDRVIDTLKAHGMLLRVAASTQLSALLAAQDTDHLPRHAAMVHRHGAEWLARPRPEEIKKLRFTPDWGEARIQGMVANRPDWCVSRQRYWGVPITLFTHKKTGELHPNTLALMEQAAQRIEQGGIDAWFE